MIVKVTMQLYRAVDKERNWLSKCNHASSLGFMFPHNHTYILIKFVLSKKKSNTSEENF
jgi:hypothetical protein